MTHRGNEFGRHPDSGENVISLGKYFDAAPYPQTSSDIVALLVLEHQTHGHNFLTRLNYESSLALKQYGHVRYLKNIADAFVKYLLFAEETPLASPVRGVSDFSREFAAAGPRDSRGRSLRDFDLQTRMFQYPCSYLIYSDAFAALPAPIREKVYERMLEVLTGKETGADYAKLSRESRRAILEILVETKSDLPKAWRTAARAR